jgi:hypothetical protein
MESSPEHSAPSRLSLGSLLTGFIFFGPSLQPRFTAFGKLVAAPLVPVDLN